MTKPWYRDWLVWFLGLTLVIGLAGVANLALDIGRPFGGYLAACNIGSLRWYLDAFNPPWWSGLAEANVPRTGTFLELDGQPYGFNEGAIYAAAQRRGASFISLTYAHHGVQIVQPIRLVPFTFSHFLDVALPEFIVSLSVWFLALMIYRSNVSDPVSRSATMLFATAAGFRWLGYTSVFRYGSVAAQIFDYLSFGILWPLFAATLMHFALTYPDRRLTLFIRLIIYANALLNSLTFTVTRLILWNRGWSPWIGALDEWVWRWSVLTWLGALLIYLLRLLWLWLRGGPARTRRQAAVMLGGMGCASVPIVTWLAGAFGPSQSNFFLSQLDLRYLYLAVPLSIAFVILRYKTFRSTDPVFVIVLIVSSSALLASLASWLTQEIMTPVATTSRPLFVPFFVMSLSLSFLWSTQASWQGLLSRLFHWEHRNYLEARLFGDDIAGQLNFAKLPSYIVQTLVTRLNVELAGLWLWDESQNALILAGRAGQWLLLPPQLLQPAVDFHHLRQFVRLDDQLTPNLGWLLALSQNPGVEVAIRLWTSDQSATLGLLVVGKRLDEEVFDERDLDILEFIARQCSLTLLAARQLAEREQAYRWATEVEERERSRMAHELHDTVQQFLSGLMYTLSANQNLLLTNPAGVAQALQTCIEEARHADRDLRQTLKDLTADELQYGLAPALTECILRFQQRTAMATTSHFSPEISDEALSPQARLALYRVVRQALDNIEHHARASQVAVTLAQANGRIEFEIADNGRGFSETDRVNAEYHGHFGLRFMDSRLRELGGALSVLSTPNKGTRIVGWLPIDA